MTIRIMLDGVEDSNAGELSDELTRPWYLHIPDEEPITFANPEYDNLKSALARAQDVRREGRDIWISTDNMPPPDGWPL